MYHYCGWWIEWPIEWWMVGCVGTLECNSMVRCNEGHVIASCIDELMGKVVSG